MLDSAALSLEPLRVFGVGSLGTLRSQRPVDARIPRGPQNLAGRGHARQSSPDNSGHSRILPGEEESGDGGRGGGQVGPESLGGKGEAVEAAEGVGREVLDGQRRAHFGVADGVLQAWYGCVCEIGESLRHGRREGLVILSAHPRPRPRPALECLGLCERHNLGRRVCISGLDAREGDKRRVRVPAEEVGTHPGRVGAPRSRVNPDVRPVHAVGIVVEGEVERDSRSAAPEAGDPLAHARGECGGRTGRGQ